MIYIAMGIWFIWMLHLSLWPDWWVKNFIVTPRWWRRYLDGRKDDPTET